MSAIVLGPITSGATWDEEGHREYKAAWLVKVDPGEGPRAAKYAPGMPLTGSIWNFYDDVDPYAWCRPQASVTPWQHEEGKDGHVQMWRVERTFSSKPGKRCQDTEIEDPLLEPQKVSGSFLKGRKEAIVDRYGTPLLSSSLERLRGEDVTFNESNDTVKIEQNVASLQLPLIESMKDTVNASPLWGLPARSVLLTGFSYDRLYRGSCEIYYKRVFEFEIDQTTRDEDGNLIGWDRRVLDEGTRCLAGRWQDGAWVTDKVDGRAPDPTNPLHFQAYQDRAGNATKVVLDGAGKPLADISSPVYITVEKYGESNFLLLGIPTVF